MWKNKNYVTVNQNFTFSQICTDMVHIGEKIKEVFDKSGMTKVAFASRINNSRENIYNIFESESIDTKKLELICEVLHFDFFQFYRKQSSSYEQLPSVENITALEKENEYLKKQVEVYEKIVETIGNKNHQDDARKTG